MTKTCTTCGGTGKKVYASTSTWRGGIGGAAMTEDVCDKCWGSGDELAPGTDLRASEARMRARTRVMK